MKTRRRVTLFCTAILISASSLSLFSQNAPLPPAVDEFLQPLPQDAQKIAADAQQDPLSIYDNLTDLAISDFIFQQVVLDTLGDHDWANEASPMIQDGLYKVARKAWSQSGYPNDLAAFAKTTAFGNITNKVQLWLQADRISGINDGAAVATWEDQSPGKRNAITVPGREPVYSAGGMNGKPSVHFNAAIGPFMDVPLGLDTTNGGFTIFMVFKVDGGGNGTHGLISPFHAPDPFASFFFMQDNPGWGGFRIFGYSYGSTFASPVAYVSIDKYEPGTWVIESVTVNAKTGVLMLHRNGKPDGGMSLLKDTEGYHFPFGGGDIQESALWRIGNNSSLSHSLNGDIAEILVFDGPLEVKDRDAAFTELGQKYAMDFPLLHYTMMFSDTFDGPNSADENSGLAARQQGALAGTRYLTSSEPPTGEDRIQIVQGSLVLTNGNDYGIRGETRASPNFDFRGVESSKSFRIRFEVTPPRGPHPMRDYLNYGVLSLIPPPYNPGYQNVPYTFEGSWASFKFRDSKPLSWPNDGASDGLGFQISPIGDVALWDGPTSLGGFGVVAGESYQVEIEVENNVMTLSVNGFGLGSGTVDYGRRSFSLNGNGGNFLTFATYADPNILSPRAVFDNLEFAIIPGGPAIDYYTILTDSFDIPDTGDANTDLDLRQAGDRATVPYTITTRGAAGSKAGIAGNTLVLEPKPAALESSQVIASLDQDFGSAEVNQSFRLMVDITPGAGSGDRWSAVKLRNSRSVDSVNEGPGFGFLIRENGVLEIFDGEVAVPTRAIDRAAVYKVELMVLANVVSITINGQPVIFNGSTTRYQLAPFSTNYISLMSFAATGSAVAPARFDNLNLATIGPVPPPPSPVDPVSLEIERGPNNTVKISWLQTPSAFLLEYSKTLEPGSWVDPNFSVNPENDRYVVTDDEGEERRFYRLRLP